MSKFPYTLEKIKGVFFRSDVNQQESFTAIVRLNLKIVNPPRNL